MGCSLRENEFRKLECAAEVLANKWLKAHEAAIKGLTDERQDVYRELRELSADPLDITLAMPKNRLQPTVELREDGTEVKLPRLDRHLLCDEEGMYPDLLNTWETKILEAEMSLETSLAWYRNPSSAKPESLGIVYYEDDQASILRPDFIFFTKMDDETIQANLIDPHGYHLADALPKLRGLRDYAEKHGTEFARIEAVAEVDDVLRFLNLKDADLRNAISTASSALSLFKGEHFQTYPTKA